ncbi:MAG: thioredoxin fold domain-containing protein [Aquificae bacterium]|nr:thioredoxin fold domain-containing protein [Aquificota bacterium]
MFFKRVLIVFTVFIFAFSFVACQKKEVSSTDSNKFKVNPEPIIQDAMKKGKFLILIFESADCKYCDLLNKEVLNDPEFQKHAEKNNVAIAVINVYGQREVTDPETGKKMSEEALTLAYRVQGYPTIVVFEPKDGKYTILYQIPGYIPKKDFMNFLEYLSSGCYKKIKYQEFVEKGKSC